VSDKTSGQTSFRINPRETEPMFVRLFFAISSTPVLTKAKGERPCYDQSIRIRAVSLNNISNGSSGFEERQSYERPVRHLFSRCDGVCH